MLTTPQSKRLVRSLLLVPMFVFAIAGNLACALFANNDDDDDGGPERGDVIVNLSTTDPTVYELVQGEAIQITTTVDFETITAGGSDEPTFVAANLPSTISVSYTYNHPEVVWTIQTSLDTSIPVNRAGLPEIVLKADDDLDSDPRFTDGESVEIELRMIPADVWRATGGAQAIAARSNRTMAVLTDGSLLEWGRTADPARGSLAWNKHVPADTGLSGVVELALGLSFSVARLDDGSIVSWGSNLLGQLGDGTTDNRAVPGPVIGVTDAVAIAASGQAAYALLPDGTVLSWGNDSQGALGNGPDIGRNPIPSPVLGLSDIVQIGAGLNHAVALRADGTVWTWGNNFRGQLGHSQGEVAVHTAAQVPGLAGVESIGAGAETTYALLADGSMLAFGRGIDGALGNGAFVDSDVPVQLSGLTGVVEIARSSGSLHYAADLGDGTAMIWGRNDFGQLGNGSLANNALPAGVPFTDIQQIFPGRGHTVMLQSAGGCGVVWAWGSNAAGELGDGSQSFSLDPDERFRAYPAPVKGIGELDCSAMGLYVTGDGSVSTSTGALDCRGAFCSEIFAVNAMPMLTATPAAGNSFVGWGKDCGNTDGTLNDQTSIQITADHHLHCTAQFQAGPSQNQSPNAAFTWTPEVPEVNELVSFDASTSSDPDGTIVSYEWDFEDDNTIDATGVTTDNTYTTAGDFTVRLRVTDDVGAGAETAHAVTVVAGSSTFTLTFTVTGDGTVSDSDLGIDCPTDCTEAYPADSVATLFATAGMGSELTAWGGDCAFAGNSTGFNLTMDSDKNCTATFGSATTSSLTVTAPIGTGLGTVVSDTPGIDCSFTQSTSVPDPCTADFSSGSFVTLTATPTGGSGFNNWGGDCASEATPVCTLDMSVDRNVTVSFE